MIKNAGSKFDDYLSSPKVRQLLLPWGYELYIYIYIYTYIYICFI